MAHQELRDTKEDLLDPPGSDLGANDVESASTTKYMVDFGQDDWNRVLGLSDDLFCVGDFDGYLRQLSPAWTDVLGWTLEELCARPFLDFVHPDDHESTVALLRDMTEDGSFPAHVNRYRTKDGGWRFLSWRGVALRDRGRIYSIARDITDEQRQGNMLRAIRRAYASYMVDEDPGALFDDLLTVLLELTDSEYGFIGEALYEEDGTPFLKTHAITNIAWDEATRAFYDENAPEGLEFRNLDTLFGAVLRTGELVLTNRPADDPRAGGLPPGHPPLDAFLGLPLRIRDEMVGMVGIANRGVGYDPELVEQIGPFLATCGHLIGAYRGERLRLEAEMSLRESRHQLHTVNNRLTAVLDAATEVSIIATDVHGQVTVFNRGAERMFGYTEDEVVGNPNPPLIAIPEELAARSAELSERYGRPIEGFDVLVEVARRDGYEAREWTSQHRDGSKFPIHLVITTMRGGDGEISGYLGVASDISGQRAALEMLEKAKTAAEAATESKSRFLANMSHEIRTPLNGLLGATEMLADTDLDANQQEIVATQEKSAELLLAVIDDILDFSKIEAGMLELDHVCFDVRSVVLDSFDLFAKRARQKGLAMTCEVDERVPRQVVGDPIRIRQVLNNLISNAIKFTEQGEVEVRSSLEPSSEETWSVQFQVRDTGIGIAPEDRHRLFRPFAQADASTTRRFGGTGLGLAICRELIDLMGGTFGVDSEEGDGSRFWFVVPLGVPTEQDLATRRGAFRPSPLLQRRKLQLDSSSTGGGWRHARSESLEWARVLLVEDNEINQRTTLYKLRQIGVQADLARDGAEALAAVRRTRYDAVLMDCQMPVMDGYEATRAIREQEAEGEHLPILAVTAHAFDSERQRCFEAGMDDFLAKPIGLDALRTLLERWLGGGPRARPLEVGEDSAGAAGAAGDRTGGERSNADQSSGDESAIDHARWDSLRQPMAGSPYSLLVGVLRQFLDETPRRMKRIEQAHAAGDAETVRELAHTLKGSALTLGFERLGRAASALERSGRAGDLDAAAVALEEVRAEHTALEPRVRAEIGS